MNRTTNTFQQAYASLGKTATTSACIGRQKEKERKKEKEAKKRGRTDIGVWNITSDRNSKICFQKKPEKVINYSFVQEFFCNLLHNLFFVLCSQEFPPRCSLIRRNSVYRWKNRMSDKQLTCLHGEMTTKRRKQSDPPKKCKKKSSCLLFHLLSMSTFVFPILLHSPAFSHWKKKKENESIKLISDIHLHQYTRFQPAWSTELFLIWGRKKGDLKPIDLEIKKPSVKSDHSPLFSKHFSHSKPK